MPTPVSMFKTNDGRLFDKLTEAVKHEQEVFLKEGLRPLFLRLVTAAGEAQYQEETCDLLVAALLADASLQQEFQKVFSKLQPQPAAPVTRRRKSNGKRTKRTHEAEQPIPADGASTEQELAPIVAPTEQEANIYAEGFEVAAPTEEHLAALDSLVGAAPLTVPEYTAAAEAVVIARLGAAALEDAPWQAGDNAPPPPVM